MTEEQLESEYQEFLYSFPYNSATPVLAVAGIGSDICMGDNCIGQAREFASRYPLLGFRYIRDCRHHSLLAPWGKGYCYLSPYLLHKEPLFLPDVPSLSRQVLCHPCSDSIPEQWRSSLTIRKTHEELHVTRRRYSKRAGGFSQSSFTYKMSATSPECPAVDDKDIAFANEQTTLSIRILERDSDDVLHLISPVHLLSSVGAVRRQDFYVLDSWGSQYAHGEKEFLRIASRISEHVGLSPEELIRFFELASDRYQRLAPGNLTYRSANATNI